MNGCVRVFLLTGSPGVGKTRAILNAIRILRTSGLAVGGVVSREVRVQGQRVGFELVDVATEQRGTLASVKGSAGPRLGRYRVNLGDLKNVGARALLNALERFDVVVCDEMGPMELLSPEFRRAVETMLTSGKPVLGVVHHSLRDPLVERAKNSLEAEVLEVTLANRDGLPEIVARRILSLLGHLDP